MYIMLCFFLIFFSQIFSNSHCLSFEDIKPKFDISACIEGTLVSMGSGKFLLKRMETAGAGFIAQNREETNPYDLRSSEITEKSSLSLIHELALYNDIDYYYYLTGEEGPPHSKIFKMELKLGDEKYYGNGSSLKRAKNSVAQLALRETSYALPPIKAKQESSSQTPTVQLNNLAMKLGMKVIYVMHNDILDDEDEGYTENKSFHTEIDSARSYVSRLNNSIYHPYKGKYTKLANEKQSGQPFSVVIYVGDKEYAGSGYTIQAARHSAAANAIKALSKLTHKEVEECLARGEACNSNNDKSPVSLLYETVQKQKLSIDFEIVTENGPAHEKVFVTKCQVGDLVTEGEGKSKKVAKKKAAENMLKKLREIGVVNVTNNNFKIDSVGKTKKKRKKNKKVIKNTVDKMARDAQNLFTSAFQYFVPDDSKPQKDATLRKRSPSDTSVDGDGKTDMHDPKTILLDLSQQKGIPINFLDLFETASKHYSLLSLGIQPQHLCLGEGTSFSLAHQKASLEAINFLYKLGLNNIVPSKEAFEYIDGMDFLNLEVSKDVLLEKET